MKLAISSGYFSPISAHHIDYLSAAAELGDRHVVIVNNDTQVKLKNSIPFQSCEDRLRIVQALSCVNIAWRSIDLDKTVCKTIEWIYGLNYDKFEKIVFCNGGDVGDCAEADTCRALGIELVYNVGGGKTNSSSWLIEKAAIEWVERNPKEAMNILNITPYEIGDSCMWRNND